MAVARGIRHGHVGITAHDGGRRRRRQVRWAAVALEFRRERKRRIVLVRHGGNLRERTGRRFRTSSSVRGSVHWDVEGWEVVHCDRRVHHPGRWYGTAAASECVRRLIVGPWRLPRIRVGRLVVCFGEIDYIVVSWEEQTTSIVRNLENKILNKLVQRVLERPIYLYENCTFFF